MASDVEVLEYALKVAILDGQIAVLEELQSKAYPVVNGLVCVNASEVENLIKSLQAKRKEL